MYLLEKIRLEKQKSTLPEGYEIVTAGELQEGDIRWNCLQDCWNANDVTMSPRHDIVIGDPVKNFHGVCRRKELITRMDCQLVLNVLDIPQYITL